MTVDEHTNAIRANIYRDEGYGLDLVTILTIIRILTWLFKWLNSIQAQPAELTLWQKARIYSAVLYECNYRPFVAKRLHARVLERLSGLAAADVKATALTIKD